MTTDNKYDATGLTKEYIHELAHEIATALAEQDYKRLLAAFITYTTEVFAHEPDPIACVSGFTAGLLHTMTTGVAPSEPSPHEAAKTAASDKDGWVCGTGLDDPEHGTFTDVFSTREEAIEAGRADVGWTDCPTFQTARIVYTMEDMPNPLDAEHACDRAENDDWGEACLEKWTDNVFGNPAAIDELQKGLDMIWTAWCVKHKLAIEAYRFEDVEDHDFVRTEEKGDVATTTQEG